MNATMVMVTGLPGTGKTTLATALAREVGAHHLNTDIIREAMGKRGQYDADSKREVYEELLRRVDALLDQGESVIIDGTFYQRRLREPFVQLATRRGIAIRWIELRAADPVIRERVSRERQHTDADFDVFQQIKTQYEPLERAHLVLRSDQLSVAEMTERAKDFLMLPA